MVLELTACLHEVLKGADEVIAANVMLVHADHACKL